MGLYLFPDHHHVRRRQFQHPRQLARFDVQLHRARQVHHRDRLARHDRDHVTDITVHQATVLVVVADHRVDTLAVRHEVPVITRARQNDRDVGHDPLHAQVTRHIALEVVPDHVDVTRVTHEVERVPVVAADRVVAVVIGGGDHLVTVRDRLTQVDIQDHIRARGQDRISSIY